MKPQLAAILRQQARTATLGRIQHHARQPTPTDEPPAQPQSRQEAKQTLKQYQSF